MTDVRCPMCGKENPPELEACQFCQARLKPLIISPPPDEGAPLDAGLGQPEEEGEAPDWLSGFRQEEGDLADESGSEAFYAEEDELPDWLDRLEDQGEAEAETIPPEEEAVYEAEEAPPELSLRDAGFEESEPIAPLSDSLFDAEEELPEWLSGEAEVTGEEEVEFLDWLSGEPEGEAVAAAAEEGPLGVGEAFQMPEEEAEEAPDWLSELTPKAEGDPDVPDWMEELDVQSASQAFTERRGEEEEEVASPEDGEEPPEWLQRIRARRQSEDTIPVGPFISDEERGEPEPETPEEPAAEGEVPDWLSDFMPQRERQEEEPQEVPDWLSQDEAGAFTFSPDDEGEAPEWQPQEEMAEESTEPAREDEEPDWLAELGGATMPSSFTADKVEEAEAQPIGGDDDMPDWLTSLGVDSTGQPPADGVPGLAFDEEEVPPYFGEPSEASADEDVLSALPDWASQMTAEEPAPEEQMARAEGDLAPAELPEWLEAMRPSGEVTPTTPIEDVSGQKLETAGPLAGLRGVLMAEPEATSLRKPLAMAIKLQVPEEQQAKVTLLEQLLKSEDRPKPIPSPAAIKPQYIIRVVIFLAMLLPIIWTLWLGGGTMELPGQGGSVPPEVLDVQRLVDALPSGAPVLLAFDYEPGYTGEMDSAASAVLARLMDKGTYLTLVSTSPTGAVQAERFIANLNKQPERSQSPFGSYANLGYIPGGAMGLSGFAAAPSQVMPYTLDSSDVWSNPPLYGLAGLGNFNLVMVITESPDTARAWIEQVGPFLEEQNTPLLMVVSAQAEPMVRPYYESSPKQVGGMLAGLYGGAAFESITGNDGLARSRWDSFSASLLISEAILLIGALTSVGSTMLVSGKKRD